MASSLLFQSRRSPVICTGGCVASSQPLATNSGLDILKKGGNAVDAAVAVAAVLNVTEPCSTGIGGDCFCLYYEKKTKQVYGLNGSGRSPKALTLDLLKQQGFDETNPPPLFHAHNVTVPGAAALWCDLLSLFGSTKLSMGEILQPAITLAEQGFPVSEITAYHWKKDVSLLQAPSNLHGKDLLSHGEAPRHGDIFRNPSLAQTFKELSRFGKKGFYEGRIGKAIVETVQKNGGTMTLEDLKSHTTEQVRPIFTTYKGIKVWEMPPNGQGITALMALNIIENFNLKALAHSSADYLHILIEAVKLSFSDTLWFCTDPSYVPVPTQEILSKTYCEKRSRLINMQRANDRYAHGGPFQTGNDTVYFTVMDAEGNACSFINSNCLSFGTGLVPEGCGFSLHCRGANFSMSPGHPNCLAPGKRPFHTIIPAMATAVDTEDLLCSFGVMGGFMQPQGHVQVLLNMAEFGMNPQQAADAPRFCVDYVRKEDEWWLFLEDGISEEVAEDLKSRGHNVQWPVTGFERSKFGRAQIITNGAWWESSCSPMTNETCNVLWAGSDPRGDGCAMGSLVMSSCYWRTSNSQVSLFAVVTSSGCCDPSRNFAFTVERRSWGRGEDGRW